MRWLVMLAGALAVAGCAEPPYTNIDNERLRALIAGGVPVYDVRRAEEWRQTGVIAGSRLLTFVDEHGRPNPEFLPRFTREVGRNDPVILICRTGSRTDVLARHLAEQLGYTNVHNVRHGITGWIRDRQPVVGN
jgi:rhodanese-related sulfurtransferase